MGTRTVTRAGWLYLRLKKNKRNNRSHYWFTVFWFILVTSFDTIMHSLRKLLTLPPKYPSDQLEQRLHHHLPIKTQSENKETAWSVGKRDLAAIALSFTSDWLIPDYCRRWIENHSISSSSWLCECLNFLCVRFTFAFGKVGLFLLGANSPETKN